MFFRGITIKIPTVSLLDAAIQMVQNRDHSFSVPFSLEMTSPLTTLNTPYSFILLTLDFRSKKSFWRISGRDSYFHPLKDQISISPCIFKALSYSMYLFLILSISKVHWMLVY